MTEREAMERFFLGQERDREWSEMTLTERAELWLSEIDIAIPSVVVRAEGDMPGPSEWRVAITATWAWEHTRRHEWKPWIPRADKFIESVPVREFPEAKYCIGQQFVANIFEHRDQHFAYFEKAVRHLVARLLRDTAQTLTTTNHETLDDYIAKHARKEPTP